MSQEIDVHVINPHGAPPEWNLPAEWQEAIERKRETEDVQAKRERRMGLTPFWEAQVRDFLVERRFFLMRNVYGWRSMTTRRVEAYFTAEGTSIPAPFHGMDAIYLAAEDMLKDSVLEAREVVVAMVQIGAIEPIDEKRAYSLYDRIFYATGQDYRPRKGTIRAASL